MLDVDIAAIDLVLLDLGLPDLDGLDVCRELRGRSDVPIIVLTARDTETDRVVGLELGADDYLGKPFGFRELLARMRAVLAPAHAAGISGVGGGAGQRRGHRGRTARTRPGSATSSST